MCTEVNWVKVGGGTTAVYSTELQKSNWLSLSSALRSKAQRRLHGGS